MRRLVVAATALVLAGPVAGCGSQQPSAAEQVPGLSVRLQRVDAALAHHKFAEARRDLRALVAEATSARRSGDLSASRAERILTAATEVLDALPSAATSPSTTSATAGSSSSSSPTSSPTDKPSRKPRPTSAPSSGPTSGPTSGPAPSSTPTPDQSPAPTTGQPSPAGSTQQATQQVAPTASPST